LFFLQRGPAFWLGIGRKLGLVQSQDMSSASSEVAGRLARVYEEYLQHFDVIYVMSFVQELEHRKGHPKSIG
jgi:hypothetical protein